VRLSTAAAAHLVDLVLNVHAHSIVLDGVYCKRGDEPPVFHELPPPTDDDIADLV